MGVHVTSKAALAGEVCAGCFEFIEFDALASPYSGAADPGRGPRLCAVCRELKRWLAFRRVLEEAVRLGA
jgi:hypothetical protein